LVWNFPDFGIPVGFFTAMRRPASSGTAKHGDGLLAPTLQFLCAGTFYFLSAQLIINQTFMAPEVRQMVGLMTFSDSAFCLISGWVMARPSVKGKGTGKGKKAPSTQKPLTGYPQLALWLLPVFDSTGLVLAFEAVRVAGSGFHQTVGGASIPIGTVLSVLILNTKFTNEQRWAIGVVVLGLAVKCKSLIESAEPFPVGAFCLVIASCFGYAMRGITMEYLSNTENPPSGTRVTLQMSVSCFLGWFVYFVVFVSPKFEELVANPFKLAFQNFGAARTIALYATHAFSRGLTSRGIMGIVKHGGSTALSLAQVTRASAIVVLSGVLFCQSDKRQCLDATGVLSAALVVAGGGLFAVVKNRAGLKKSVKKTSRSSKSTASVGKSTAMATSTTVTRRRGARK
jgi:hypothetical protein